MRCYSIRTVGVDGLLLHGQFGRFLPKGFDRLPNAIGAPRVEVLGVGKGADHQGPVAQVTIDSTEGEMDVELVGGGIP